MPHDTETRLSALALATWNGYDETVALLLECGADPCQTTGDQKTMLTLAHEGPSHTVASILEGAIATAGAAADGSAGEPLYL